MNKNTEASLVAVADLDSETEVSLQKEIDAARSLPSEVSQ